MFQLNIHFSAKYNRNNNLVKVTPLYLNPRFSETTLDTKLVFCE